MPRPKRSVGFWRADPAPSKAALQPPPDRWTGTIVDGWSRATIHGLRGELLARRKVTPDIKEDALVAAANAWLAAREPTTTPRKSGKKGKPAKQGPLRRAGVEHVRVLMNPPRQTKPSGKSTAPRDRSPRPTTLSASEIAAVLKAGQRSAANRPATPATRKPKSSPPKPRLRAWAGIGTYGASVAWDYVRGATSVHVRIQDDEGCLLHDVERPIESREVRFAPPPRRRFTAQIVFSGRDGERVGQMTVRHPSRRAAGRQPRRAQPPRSR